MFLNERHQHGEPHPTVDNGRNAYEYLNDRLPKLLAVTRGDFSHIKIVNCRFKRVNFRESNFQNAELIGCVFEDSDLSECVFTNANIIDCIFESTKLDSCIFDQAKLHNVSFGASFEDMMHNFECFESGWYNLPSAATEIDDDDLEPKLPSNIKVIKTLRIIKTSTFNRARFIRTKIVDCNFNGTDMKETHFANLSISKSTFAFATFDRAIFTEITIKDSCFIGCDYNQVAQLRDCKAVQSNFTDALFKPAGKIEFYYKNNAVIVTQIVDKRDDRLNRGGRYYSYLQRELLEFEKQSGIGTLQPPSNRKI